MGTFSMDLFFRGNFWPTLGPPNIMKNEGFKPYNMVYTL